MNASNLFNSPLEIGLRALMLLAESHPKPLDLQRLVILDYLLVHSGDIDGGPESIHPASPLRAGEVSIRRGLIEEGLHLLASKGLISQVIDESGISYMAEDLAASFLDSLTSDHVQILRKTANWVVENIGTLSNRDATELLERTTGRWKTEFVFEEIEDGL